MLAHVADEDERQPTGLSRTVDSRSTLYDDVRLLQESFCPVVQLQYQIAGDDDA
jgi:hypothetical protein